MNDEQFAHHLSGRLTRRQYLLGALAASSGALLAACGSPAPATPSTALPAPTSAPAAAPTTAPAAAPTALPAATVAPTAAAKPTAAAAASHGTLRLAIGDDFPSSVQGIKSGYELMFLGAAETLTRVSAEGKLVPWLATSWKNVDPTTWSMTLRQNVKFWDGSAMTAQDVADSLAADWAGDPDADSQISKDTKVTVAQDGSLTFKTPEPVGNLPNALSSQHFIIHKQDDKIMTGPYQPTQFDADRQMTMTAFADYWGGPPPIASVVVNLLVDANARALALQAGDVDMVYILPAPILKNFPASDYDVSSVQSHQCDFIELNNTRFPFNDRDIRDAFSSAVDRDQLLSVIMDGQGAVASGVFPTGSGVDVEIIQTTDTNHSTQLLDRGGWVMGSDGVRSKNGQRLAFTLLSQPQQPEMTPIAVAIQGQLKPLGFDMSVQELQQEYKPRSAGDFDAAFNSMNVLVTGDPYFFYSQTIMKGAQQDDGRYDNPQVDNLVTQLRGEPDPAKRSTLSRQIQDLLKQDVPNVYLLFTPKVTVTRKGFLKGYAPNPNNQYIIDSSFGVA